MLELTKLIIRKTFNINDSFGMKMSTRLRLGVSNPCEHTLKDDFKDTPSPICSCRIEAKTLTHCLLHCYLFNENQANLMNELGNVLIFL